MVAVGIAEEEKLFDSRPLFEADGMVAEKLARCANQSNFFIE